MTLSHFIKQNNKCNTETKWYAPRIEGKCAHISLLDKYLGAKAVIDPDEAFRYGMGSCNVNNVEPTLLTHWPGF